MHLSGRLRGGRLLRRFAQHERGVAAVEFALVAIPFLGFMFAIIEAALIFWAQQVLDTALADATREVYTGKFQTDNTATPSAQIPGKLKTLVCSRVTAMFDCTTKLTVDVQTYSAFPFPIPNPIVTAANGTRSVDPNFGQYNAPGPDQIVLVRAVVIYPVFVNLLGANASNLNATTRALISAAAFRSEPYQ
jgi:Flp pilus assembly protein TadG